MKKRGILWLGVSGLIVLSLVLASCGKTATPATTATSTTAPTTTPATTATPTTTPTTTPATTAPPAVEKPKYGGELRLSEGTSPGGFDPALTVWSVERFICPVYEKPLEGDIDKLGPRGENVYSFAYYDVLPVNVAAPKLVESFELTGDKIIYHVRHGVHFQNKPPVNGREMDAEDMALSMTRIWNVPRFKAGYWSFVDSITQTDKWTVEIKISKYNAMWKWMLGEGYYTEIVPRELVQQDLCNKWQYACGTGPFIMTDFVTDVAAHYKKNPDYWGTTSIGGKAYQIPFVDTISLILIPDSPTFMAALRTGKIDWGMHMYWSTAGDLLKTAPKMTNMRFVAQAALCLHLRTDTAPFTDIRVRKALFYAIDNKDIVDKVYGGYADPYNSMVPNGWLDTQYTPFEELSPADQMYFGGGYPEEAKKLLTEAGYPQGFTFEFMVPNNDVAGQDCAALLAAYWKKIGVTANLKVMERTSFDSTFYSGKHSPALIVTRSGPPITEMQTRQIPGGSWNISRWEDPVFQDMISRAFMEQDETKLDAIIKKANIYWMEQAVERRMAQPYVWSMWWPWVKNFQGDYTVGYHWAGACYARLWIDTELKKKMGY